LLDGSDHLVYDPKTGKVQTWNERQGIKPVQTQREGYTVEYAERPDQLAPHGKAARIDVLFQKPPSEAEILKILTTELVAATGKQTPKLDTAAWAKTGPATDRAAQTHVEGASGGRHLGRYLVVYFDPETGQIRDRPGNVLHFP
jgi:hypothetical protein